MENSLFLWPFEWKTQFEVQDLGYLGEFDIFLGIIQGPWGGTRGRTMVMYKLGTKTI